MSPNLTPRRALGQTELPAAERSHRRFPVHLDLRYKVLSGGAPLQGLGLTQQLSTADVRFSADKDLPRGAEVALSLDWPVRLNGVCPLQLMVFGRIMRTDETGNTLNIAQYEFRTRMLPARLAGKGVGSSALRIYDLNRDDRRAVSTQRG